MKLLGKIGYVRQGTDRCVALFGLECDTNEENAGMQRNQNITITSEFIPLAISKYW